MGNFTNMPVESDKVFRKAVADAKTPHETVQQREFRQQRETAIPDSQRTTNEMIQLHRNRQEVAADSVDKPKTNMDQEPTYSGDRSENVSDSTPVTDSIFDRLNSQK